MNRKRTLRTQPLLAGLLGVAFLVAAGGFIAAQGGADILAKLGLDKASAGENLLGALTSGYIYNSAAAKAFKALPVPAKVEFVRSGLAWVKAYTASPEFKAAYKQHRDGRKPTPPIRSRPRRNSSPRRGPTWRRALRASSRWRRAATRR